MNQVEKKIKKIISQHLGVTEKEITRFSHLTEDLNASPLEIADLAAKLERAFQIKISEEAVQNFSTVESITAYIADNL